MKTYHIGFLKKGKTLVIQARECKDDLSCELWKYQGEHQITKRELKEKAREILACTNDLYRKTFERVRVE